MPPYPHQEHLPYAREPLKSFYVFQRLLTTLLIVPYWCLYYLILPRSARPRSSWSVRQVIYVKFTRRVYKVTEVAGVTWGTRNPDEEPKRGSLKQTRFKWTPALPKDLRSGVVNWENVPFSSRVGTFVWPKNDPGNKIKDDIETSGASSPLIGVFMHGGGYCHMSAHETSRTSRIPSGLMKRGLFHEIYSVEYRLLQHAHFPAQLQDGAAVYADIIEKYKRQDTESKISRPACRIVLIGDSSGGNLALALARWIRDEGKLPMPHGLLLLSPSCDTSHAFPLTPSSYVPRPNAETDYLVDTPEPRALLQRTFLGFQYHPGTTDNKDQEKRLRDVVHSEYVSPASSRVLKRYGHPVVAEWEDDDHAATLTPFGGLAPDGLPTTLPASGAAALALTGGAPMSVPTPSRQFPGLFAEFPRTFVLVGDAERLTNEVKALIGTMERDLVDVETFWAKDACHDILMIAPGWWDEKVRDEVWRNIEKWIGKY